MGYRKVKAEKIIEKFLDQAQTNINIEQVILFGSHALNKKANSNSDIDLAIISSDFEGMNPIERMALLGRIAWDADVTIIEAIGYTPKEYRNTTKYDFASEIKRTGKIIFKAA